jgi:hypothetical protein
MHGSGLGRHSPIKPILFNFVKFSKLWTLCGCNNWTLCGQMMLILFNIFNLVSYVVYVAVIFGFGVVQIYGLGLDRHGPINARHVLGSN